jgi:DNA recombination protein Rad52
MSFTDTTNKLLQAPLSSANVKTRKQAGRTLSYIEGWVAIAEANRIFGHDGWDRETIYCKEVSRQEVTIGQQQKPGWKVGYEAKVKIYVDGVTREGTGHGSGMMTDLFDCIESAAKEAETDGMKRALMTFGNPFGLALYDKEQKNVVRDGGMSNEADQQMADNVNAYVRKTAEKTAEVADLPRNQQEWQTWAKNYLTAVNACNSITALDKVVEGTRARLDACEKASEKLHAHVTDSIQGRRDILETPTDNTLIGAG